MASIQSACIRFLLRRVNLWNKPLVQIREELINTKPQGMPLGVTEDLVTINGVNCNVLIPSESIENKAIVYFHGGGGCLGIYHTNREFVARIAKECGMKVFLPDYRLAPENPFPAAFQDAAAVYQGLLMKGYSASDIGVVGDSSGCGLLLSALLVMKENGVKMPSVIGMITPMLDFGVKGESFQTKAKKDPFRLKDPLGVAKIYVGANNPLSPSISPLYGDLSGLPPIFIHAAEYDVFLSDANRLEAAAKQVGVAVELKVWKKMWHIFHMQDTIVPEAKNALREMCTYVTTKLK